MFSEHHKQYAQMGEKAAFEILELHNLHKLQLFHKIKILSMLNMVMITSQTNYDARQFDKLFKYFLVCLFVAEWNETFFIYFELQTFQ